MYLVVMDGNSLAVQCLRIFPGTFPHARDIRRWILTTFRLREPHSRAVPSHLNRSDTDQKQQCRYCQRQKTEDVLVIECPKNEVGNCCTGRCWLRRRCVSHILSMA